MSVNIVPTQQPSTFWQRLTGTEPKTVVRETSTTTISSTPGGSFDLKTALRNGGIGAAVAGALGGVSLLGKVALPIIGKVGSLTGLVRLAGIGGALGVATAAAPLIGDAVRDRPAAKAAVTGAAIGAAAGAILPLVPISLGAAVGAGVALLVHNRSNRPARDYPVYPGYQAYPGFRPYGTAPNTQVPAGLVPVTPNYGMYGQTAMSPWGNMSGYGLPQAGYGMGVPGGYGVGYGVPGMTLPMQGVGVAAPGAQPVASQPAVAEPGARAAARPARPARPAARPGRRPRAAKTFTDRSGNLRQVGTGRIVRPASGLATVRPGTPAPVGFGAVAPQATVPQAAAGYGVLTSPYDATTAAAAAAMTGGINPAGLPAALPTRPTT